MASTSCVGGAGCNSVDGDAFDFFDPVRKNVLMLPIVR